MKSHRRSLRMSVIAACVIGLTVMIASILAVALPQRAMAHAAASERQALLAQGEQPKVQEPNAVGWQLWRMLDPDIRAKVNPRLLDEFRGAVVPTHLGGADVAGLPALPRSQTRYLVYMREQPDLSALESQVFASAADRRAAAVDMLNSFTSASQAPVRALLDDRISASSVAGYQPFYVANVIAVEGNLLTLIELAQREDVAYIDANYPLVPMWDPRTFGPQPAAQDTPDALSPRNWNIDLVDADRVWQELGIRGTGAVVAGFDTGVTYDHPALRDTYRGLQANGDYDHNYSWFEPDSRLYPDGNLGESLSNVPYDCDYWGTHGTHTMGTMVGDGGVPGTQIGMAPAARWIAVPGICFGTMPGYRGDDIGGIKAFQWLLCPTDLTGDPASADCSKAPDVINNSWGSANPTSETFRPIVKTLRQAGVAAVFASGNPSAGPGSIGSPASIPEGITVGATDSYDEVTYFSGQGPSFYAGEQKPELSAPGLYVLSSVGGYSDYGEGSGTSMAAPHVAGLIALLVSADLRDGIRDFDVDELERFMTHTAVDLGALGPDGEYGYGRINALAAVSWAVSAGDLAGAVRTAGSGLPVREAQITGAKIGGDDQFTTTTGASGLYSTTVPGGVYNVDVTAWGHTSKSFPSQQVIANTQSIIDFVLDALPSATISGTVTGPAGPVGGVRITVDGAPAYVATTTATDGSFALTLPIGRHDLILEATGYRRHLQSVDVVGAGVIPDIALTAAPRILLVDAEARFGWFLGWPVHAFFSQALDARGFGYDFWPVQYTRFEDTDTLEDGTIGYGTPSLDTLQGYDVVIWTHSGCYEGYYGCMRSMGTTVNDALQGYLDGGGKIIFSGQDIARFEDGSTLLDDYIRADFVSSSAASRGDTVNGTAFLDDLELTVTNASLYGYANGAFYLSPDSVMPQADDEDDDPERPLGLSYPIMTYARGTGAAALASVSCEADFRTILFALGLENVGPRAGEGAEEFAEVLDRSVNWLLSDRPAVAVQSSFDFQWSQITHGEVAVYSLRLANEGTEAANVGITLAGNAWPSVVKVDGVEVDGPVLVPPCGQVTLEIEVTPPQTAINGTTDVLTVTLSGVDGADRSYAVETLIHANWEYETAMSIKRWYPVLAAQPDDSYVYMIGGYGPDPNYPEYSDYRPTAMVTRYNSCTRVWEDVPSAPMHIANTATAAADGKIYVIGGTTTVESLWGYAYNVPTEKVMAYDAAMGTWSLLAPLPQPITQATAAAVDGKIYLFGGDDWYGYLDTVLVYDIAADTWSNLSTIPDGGRAYASAAAIDGRIYLSGNQDDERVLDIFDTATATWSQTSPMQHMRYELGVVATTSGYLYAMGGAGGFDYSPLPAERYDPSTDRWQMVSAPNQYASHAQVAYAEGRVFSFDTQLESLAVDSSFCTSSVSTNTDYALPGSTVDFSWNIFSSVRTIPAVGIEHRLPPELSFVAFKNLPEGTVYDEETRAVRWTGTLAGGSAPRQIEYTVKVGSLQEFAWENGDQFDSEVRFAAEGFPAPGQAVGFVRDQSFTVLLPDFEPSSKRASGDEALSGVPFTYTIDILSTNVAGDVVSLVDVLPESVTMVPGTLTASTGEADYDAAARTVSWTGEVTSPSTVVRPSGGFTWGDSNGEGDVPDVEYSWIDVSQTGSYAGSGDDYYVCDLPVGFAFPFFGVKYEKFCVSTNGWINFGGATSSALYNMCPLSFDGIGTPRIAAIWDDLYLFGGMYYETIGVAPNRQLVVQWRGVISYSSFGYEEAEFQLVLSEDGTVDLNILSAGDLDGFSSSTGIEGAEDMESVTYACNRSNSLSDELTVRFLPPGPGGDPAWATVAFQAVADETEINQPITNAVYIETSTNTYTRTVTTRFNTLALDKSSLVVTPSDVEPDEIITFTARLRNTGLKTAENATLQGPVPTTLVVDPGSVTCSVGTCAVEDGELIWRGPVSHAEETRVAFQARLASALPDNTQVPMVLELEDGHGSTVTFATSFTVRRSDLARSTLVMQPPFVEPGGASALSLNVRNTGHRTTEARVVLSGPDNTSFTLGAPACSAGTCALDEEGRLVWDGIIAPRSLVQLRLPLEFAADATYGETFTFSAVVTDLRWDEQFTLTDRVMIAHNLFMPSLRTTGPEPGDLYLPLIR